MDGGLIGELLVSLCVHIDRKLDSLSDDLLTVFKLHKNLEKLYDWKNWFLLFLSNVMRKTKENDS
jgi:hypothetical protein